MLKCPNCESKRVVKMGKGAMALVVFCCGSFIFFLLGCLLPFLWVGIPVCCVLAVLLLAGSSVYQCQDCRNTWRVPKGPDIKAA